MIYNYLYGRSGEGYTCINRDELPFTNEDYDRLKSFIVYEAPGVPEGIGLPEELYFYNDVLSIGRVAIIGRTVFVKGGTGMSGVRDTSLAQKYIITGEDYDRLLSDCSYIFEKRSYYDRLEEYFDGEAGKPVVGSLQDGVKASETGITEDVFIRLLYCCISAFSDRERRVYIYLPDNSTDGTVFAQRLMRLVLESLPAFLYSNAGFVTYLPSFESSTLNPVPNEVSVIFIARSKENYLKRSRVDSRNYVFDFENGEYPSVVIDDKTYNTLKGVWLRPEVRDILNECLVHVFKKGTGVLSEVFASLLVLARPMSRENRAQILNDKRNAVLDLLNYGIDELLPDGLSMLENNLLAIFETDHTDAEFLSFAGRIYEKSGEYRNYITTKLCCEAMKCLANDDIDSIFDITDYEYTDEKLNDDILDMIYSKELYRPLAELLFTETVSPVLEKKNVKFSEKLSRLLEFVSSSITPKYREFADSYCVEFILGRVNDYLVEYDGEVRKRLGEDSELSYSVLTAGEGGPLSERLKLQAAEMHFEVVCGLEELLSAYLSVFSGGYREYLADICRNSVDGIKNNFKLSTSRKTRDILAAWDAKYGGIMCIIEA